MLTQAAAYKRLNTQQPVFAVHINGERVGLHADYDRALDHANDLNLLHDPTGWDTPAKIRDWATGAR